MSLVVEDVQVLTVEQRWKAAFADVRKAGIRVRQNVMSCCVGCIDGDMFGGNPYILTFGGQGNAYSWVDGEPFYRDSLKPSRGWRARPKRVDKVYINWSGEQTAQITVDAFRRHGFEVEWNGSPYQTVIVSL